MLEGLDAVDWERLTHAYGPAVEVPVWIRRLASPDPEVWVAALDSLHNTLCHQLCSVYQATPAAVPFLLELLTEPSVRCRGKILQFLGNAVAASSDLDADEDDLFDDDDDEEAQPNDAEFEEIERQLAEETSWVEATRTAVWAGLDLYLDLLTDLDKRIRVVAPYTLGMLAQHACDQSPGPDILDAVAERLRKHLPEEPNELVRASILFALGQFRLAVPDTAAFLEAQVADAGASEVARLSAALAIAEKCESPSSTVTESLLRALEEREQTNRLFKVDGPQIEGKHHPLAKAYREMGTPLGEQHGTGFDPADIGADEDFSFPWLDTPPSFLIQEHLVRPGVAYADRLLSLLVPDLDAATPYEIERIAKPVFVLAFGPEGTHSAPRREPPFTARQSDILRRIYDNVSLWATNIGNGWMLFQRFGFPEERSEWARLLGIQERPLTDAEIPVLLDRLAPGQQYSWLGPEIRRLVLRQIGSSAFLRRLVRYPDLDSLDMSCVHLADADLCHLRALPKLTHLEIPGSQITDAGLEIIASLPQLTRLNISNTKITDAGLRRLDRLERLIELSVYLTSLSEAAIQSFEQAHPGCTVRRLTQPGGMAGE